MIRVFSWRRQLEIIKIALFSVLLTVPFLMSLWEDPLLPIQAFPGPSRFPEDSQTGLCRGSLTFSSRTHVSAGQRQSQGPLRLLEQWCRGWPGDVTPRPHPHWWWWCVSRCGLAHAVHRMQLAIWTPESCLLNLQDTQWGTSDLSRLTAFHSNHFPIASQTLKDCSMVLKFNEYFIF